MPKNLVNPYFFTTFALFKNQNNTLMLRGIRHLCVNNFRDKRYFINAAPSVQAETPTKVCFEL